MLEVCTDVTEYHLVNHSLVQRDVDHDIVETLLLWNYNVRKSHVLLTSNG